MKDSRIAKFESVTFKFYLASFLIITPILLFSLLFYLKAWADLSTTVQSYIFISWIAILFIISGLISALYNWWAKPIQKLFKDIEVIRLSNLRHKIDLESNDELSIIARRVETIADKLATSYNRADKIVKNQMDSVVQERLSLSLVLDNIGIGIIVINRDGLIILANTQADDRFDALGSIIGHSLFNYVDQEHFKDAMVESFESGTHVVVNVESDRTMISPYVRDNIQEGYVITLWPRGSSKILQPASRASRPEFYDFDLLTTVPRDSQELATTLEDATIVVFDTETTGLFPSSGDKIISIGAVKIRDKKIRRSEFFETLVNPERDIPESSMEFHHISNDMVKGQPVLKEVIPQFLEFSSNGILLGHNVAFDLKFLNIELEAEGKEPLSIPTLDTLLISYLLHDHFDSHNLKDIGHRLGVKVVGLHTALGDALTTAEIFIKMISLLKARGITTIGQTIEFSAKAGTLLKEQSKF